MIDCNRHCIVQSNGCCSHNLSIFRLRFRRFKVAASVTGMTLEWLVVGDKIVTLGTSGFKLSGSSFTRNSTKSAKIWIRDLNQAKRIQIESIKAWSILSQYVNPPLYSRRASRHDTPWLTKSKYLNITSVNVQY